MSYALLAIHVAMILIARRVWISQGRVWTVAETALCVVMPFAAFLFFIMLSPLIGLLLGPLLPEADAWLRKQEAVGGFIACLLPLGAFWTWFFLAEGKRKNETPEMNQGASK